MWCSSRSWSYLQIWDRHFPSLKIVCMSHSDPAWLRDTEEGSEKGAQLLSTIHATQSPWCHSTFGPPPHHGISQNGRSASKAGKTSPLYQTAFKTQLWAPFLPSTIPFWCTKFCNPQINIIRGPFCTFLGELRRRDYCSLLATTVISCFVPCEPLWAGCWAHYTNSCDKGFGPAWAGSYKSCTIPASHGSP